MSQPLRIAIVQHELWSDAPEVVAHQARGLAEELDRSGYDVTMFGSRPLSRTAPFRYVRIPTGGRNTAWQWVTGMRRVDLSEFDLVHVLGDNAWPFTTTKLTWLRSTFRTCQGASRDRGVRDRMRWGRRRIGEWLDVLTTGTPVPISEKSRVCLLSHQDHIPCGTEIQHVDTRVPRSEEPTILFLDIGDSADHRSHVLEVFRQQVRPLHPDAQLWMVTPEPISGPGIEVLVDPEVDELTDRLRRAWVLCILDEQEQFGIAYSQALAAGTPIVTTSNVAAQELLLGRFGKMTDDANVGSDISQLLSSPVERAALSEAGLRRAEELSWASMTTRYLDVYRRRIGDATPPAPWKHAAMLAAQPGVRACKAAMRGVENLVGARLQDAAWKLRLVSARESLSWSIRNHCVSVDVEKIYMGGIRGFTAAELVLVSETPALPTTSVADGDIADLYRRFAADEEVPRPGEDFMDVPAIRRNIAVARNARGEDGAAALKRVREILDFRRRRFEAGLDRIDRRGPRPLLRRFVGTDLYEVVDGHHRLGAAVARGESAVWVDITWSLAAVPSGLRKEYAGSTPE